MLIRKVSVAALIAALIFATTPSFACTGISLKAGDGAAIRGRTLEFGFPMQSKVLVVPAGKEMSGTLPDGGKGLTYTSRYAFVGANALDLPAILDGINDQGLSVGLFYFPGYAKYADVTDENKSRAHRAAGIRRLGARQFRHGRRGARGGEGHRRRADARSRPRQPARRGRRRAFLPAGQVRQVAGGRAGRRHAESA